jgi:hypothetical protein
VVASFRVTPFARVPRLAGDELKTPDQASQALCGDHNPGVNPPLGGLAGADGAVPPGGHRQRFVSFPVMTAFNSMGMSIAADDAHQMTWCGIQKLCTDGVDCRKGCIQSELGDMQDSCIHGGEGQY